MQHRNCNSIDCTVHGLFVPWTVRTVDCSYPSGLFVPWTIRTITGRFVPCWERRHSLYSASQPPWGFLVIFPKRLGVFSPNFTCLLHVPTYGKLQIFVQLSPTLTKLCHINCDHPACVSANGGLSIWWWSRLIWHNFVKVGDNWIKICRLPQIGTCNR